MHVPLLLAADGRRLSKRHAARSIAQYRAAGASASQLLGLLVPAPTRSDRTACVADQVMI
jgi:glutamyl/glutaminyl-tRNA synthetase